MQQQPQYEILGFDRAGFRDFDLRYLFAVTAQPNITGRTLARSYNENAENKKPVSDTNSKEESYND